MAVLFKPEELHPHMNGWLEDRATGDIREANILGSGTKGFCIELEMPEARFPIMVTRYSADYNKLTKTGWRFWDERPDSDDWRKWDLDLKG